MSIIDIIFDARDHLASHGWIGADHPAVAEASQALENGSLSAFDAKLAQVVVSEAVRPTDGFSGAVVGTVSDLLGTRGHRPARKGDPRRLGGGQMAH